MHAKVIIYVKYFCRVFFVVTLRDYELFPPIRIVRAVLLFVLLYVVAFEDQSEEDLRTGSNCGFVARHSISNHKSTNHTTT